jgi:hypothetical protein
MNWSWIVFLSGTSTTSSRLVSIQRAVNPFEPAESALKKSEAMTIKYPQNHNNTTGVEKPAPVAPGTKQDVEMGALTTAAAGPSSAYERATTVQGEFSPANCCVFGLTTVFGVVICIIIIMIVIILPVMAKIKEWS